MREEKEDWVPYAFFLAFFFLGRASKSKAPSADIAKRPAPSSGITLTPQRRTGLATSHKGYNLLIAANPLQAVLTPGDFAKLVFQNQTTKDTEGMFVLVTSASGKGSQRVYKGTLDNDPLLIPIKAGEKVAFVQGHIIAAELKEGGPG